MRQLCPRSLTRQDIQERCSAWATSRPPRVAEQDAAIDRVWKDRPRGRCEGAQSRFLHGLTWAADVYSLGVILFILRHPAFTDNPGKAVGMTSETVRQDTGVVVIVQSREEEALKPELALARQMATWTVISAIPGVLFVVFAGVYNGWRRRRRSRRRSQAAP